VRRSEPNLVNVQAEHRKHLVRGPVHHQKLGPSGWSNLGVTFAVGTAEHLPIAAAFFCLQGASRKNSRITLQARPVRRDLTTSTGYCPPPGTMKGQVGFFVYFVLSQRKRPPNLQESERPSPALLRGATSNTVRLRSSHDPGTRGPKTRDSGTSMGKRLRLFKEPSSVN